MQEILESLTDTQIIFIIGGMSILLLLIIYLVILAVRHKRTPISTVDSHNAFGHSTLANYYRDRPDVKIGYGRSKNTASDRTRKWARGVGSVK